MAEKVLKIEGMTCNHCVARVEKALSGLAGVNNVAVSLENEEAKLEYDEQQVTMDDFKDAVEEAGYKVK